MTPTLGESGGRADGERRTRTADTSIFSRALYQLSYLAATADPTASRVPRMSSPCYPSQPSA